MELKPALQVEAAHLIWAFNRTKWNWNDWEHEDVGVHSTFNRTKWNWNEVRDDNPQPRQFF